MKEQGKKPQSKSYMWLYRSGIDNDESPPIVLYDYKPSRRGSNAADFLKGFHGYLHTDGYAGYGLQEIPGDFGRYDALVRTGTKRMR